MCTTKSKLFTHTTKSIFSLDITPEHSVPMQTVIIISIQLMSGGKQQA